MGKYHYHQERNEICRGKFRYSFSQWKSIDSRIEDSMDLVLDDLRGCSSRIRSCWGEDDYSGLYRWVYRGVEDRDVRERVCGGERKQMGIRSTGMVSTE